MRDGIRIAETCGRLRLGAHVGAENGELAAEEEAQIDLGVVAGGGSAGDQAAAACEAGYAVVPGGHAHVFEDYVHSALPCQAADFVLNFLRFVIDYFVRAEFEGLGELGVVAAGGDDAAAEHFCDLNRGGAYAAARSENEHFFRRLKLCARNEHVPSGLKNQWDCGGLFERKIFRIREAIHFRAADEFRATAIDQVPQIRELRTLVIATGAAGRAFSAANARREQNLLAKL